MNWLNAALRLGPWCGLIMPGIDVLVNASVDNAQPHYSAMQDYISDLTALDVRYSGLIRGWWVAFPFLFAPFILALRVHVQARRAPWASPALLTLFAVGVLGCGFFHCDPGCRGLTFSAQAHFIASDICAAALFLAPPALAWTLWRDPRCRVLRWISLAWVLIGAAAGVGLYLAGAGYIPYPGLYERIFYGLYYLWVIIVSSHLLRTRHTLSPAPLAR